MCNTHFFYKALTDALKTALLRNTQGDFDGARYRTLVAGTLNSLTISIPVIFIIQYSLLIEYHPWTGLYSISGNTGGRDIVLPSFKAAISALFRIRTN